MCADSRGTRAPPTFWRYRVMPAPAPGMAAAQTTHTQPRSAKHAVGLERFEEVGRTSWFETASGRRSAQQRKNRGNKKLVTSNKKTREKEHQGARIEARSARRNHSSFNCW